MDEQILFYILQNYLIMIMKEFLSRKSITNVPFSCSSSIDTSIKISSKHFITYEFNININNNKFHFI